MFSIVVDRGVHEVPVEFRKVEHNGKTSWIGEIPMLGEGIIVTETENGFEEDMVISGSISTPQIVIFNRFLNAHEKYREELGAGFEPDENEDDSITFVQHSPYDPDEIKIRRESFSVYEMNRMMTEQQDVDLNPDFQRNLVWDNSRKSALIESILLGIPIPVFYFAENRSGVYSVVDGLQRLSTIRQYFNNDFPLKNLEHIRDCEGKYYKEDTSKARTMGRSLERKHSRRLENAQLIVNVIESASPHKVKYDIFKRLNTGGRPLNHQEIRNCIAIQPVRNLLKELASSEPFLHATGKSISDYRMDAQELVLRFISFRFEREGKLSYQGEMNSFLDDGLEVLNDIPLQQHNRIKSDFLKSMNINYYLFGRYCFRKCLTEHLRPSARKQYVNKALFVTWSIEAMNVNINKINSVPFESFAFKVAKMLDAKEKYYTILTTGTSDKLNLREGAEIARNLLRENDLL